MRNQENEKQKLKEPNPPSHHCRALPLTIVAVHILGRAHKHDTANAAVPVLPITDHDVTSPGVATAPCASLCPSTSSCRRITSPRRLNPVHQPPPSTALQSKEKKRIGKMRDRKDQMPSHLFTVMPSPCIHRRRRCHFTKPRPSSTSKLPSSASLCDDASSAAAPCPSPPRRCCN